jgi:hypothetical protein
LSYLPTEEVKNAYIQLIAVAPTSDFSFSDYVLETYILTSTFNPSLWAGNPKDEHQTTNGAEAFDRHFNEQFYTPHPHIHKVIDVILNIQVETAFKISLITNNINNYRRKESTEAIKTKINLWTK